MEKNQIECRQCQYYYITFDKNFPYGCRAFGFKSPVKPCLEVRKASGSECLEFQLKQLHSTHEGN
jgi:hypothetical protein